MSQNTADAALYEVTFGQPKVPSVRGFRRRPASDTVVEERPAAVEPDFEPDAVALGFEPFGRGGLDLGGLYRDRQWVGAWGSHG